MNELPRVLLCSFEVVPSPTAGARRLTQYVQALQGRYSVVAMTTKPPDVSHIERYHGARLLRVPVGQGELASRLQAFDRAVRRQLESEEYLVAHFTDPFGGNTLCELRPTYGYRLVYDAQTFPSQDLRFTHPQLEDDRKFLARVRRQELYCLMNADAVITGSLLAARTLGGLGVSEENLTILRAPVELSEYAPATVGEPTHAPMRVLYLGSQAGWHGLPVLLRAMQQVVRQTPATLRIVGPRHATWHKRLEEQVRELGLGDHVRFEGPAAPDDLPAVLAASDVGVVPMDDSERNRTGLTPLAKVSDYLAAGRPVVAADLPICRDLVPEAAARFYRPSDPSSLAGALLELAGNPRLRGELGRLAREEAARTVQASHVREQLLGVYAGVLERGGITPPVEPREEAAADGLTATPTNRVLDGGAGSGPTPTNKVLRAGAESDDPDEYTYPAAVGPAWASPSKWKTGSALTHDWTPTSVRIALQAEEPDEISSDDIVEADGLAAEEAIVKDPWLTQLLHGYCPPEGVQFARPTPPTNFPGRENT